ncbi:hypothetical protein CBR_g21764 [Chara braunii]|uniref:BI1-like protein n=1 Tax=Chara braunii TaxID=69332 RepID=A0A388L1A2_CHABU|nr:hypothetical protein CBR_g21764 [Chara braunii]|eukprot:GBG76104.1 hypothetical protein CBR_g21764 [Chara braunii]
MYGYFRKSYDDVEGGYQGSEPLLYSGLEYEDTYMRWGFIRKVYGIVLSQAVLTILASLVVLFISPVRDFVVSNPAIVLLTVLLQLGVLCFLYCYRHSHPANIILLGLWTITFSVTIGATCAFVPGLVLLEALLLVAAVVVSLTGYTFWACRKGYGFSYLGPMLFSALIVLFIWSLIQIVIVPGPVGKFVYALVGSLLFSLYIVYDTDNLINGYDYDEYVWASVALYLDIANLFVLLLDAVRGLPQTGSRRRLFDEDQMQGGG